MAPTSSLIQGLNVVQPQESPSGLTDAQDLLATPPFSHDLAAQLDLWSNVHFAHDGETSSFLPSSDLKREFGAGAARSSSTSSGSSSSSSENPSASHLFDSFFAGINNTNLFNSLENGFGGDVGSLFDPSAFSQASANGGASHEGLSIDPALASLSSHHDMNAQSSVLPISFPTSNNNTKSSVSTESGAARPSATASANKKAKTNHSTRKRSASILRAPSAPSSNDTVTETAASADSKNEEDDAEGDEPPIEKDENGKPISPAEDKRRRNTAASARFRLKKKEREQAMEQKAKDLESKVNELERECEALRRENGWLKGLVVGVTGGTNGGGLQMPSINGMPVASSPVAVTPAKRGSDEVV